MVPQEISNFVMVMILGKVKLFLLEGAFVPLVVSNFFMMMFGKVKSLTLVYFQKVGASVPQAIYNLVLIFG